MTDDESAEKNPDNERAESESADMLTTYAHKRRKQRQRAQYEALGHKGAK